MSGRLGVYGGMFDPVHRGHFEAARYAISLLNLDKLLLVPCANPNHRDPATASAEQRLHMLELVAAQHRRMEVDAREIHRPGISYSVDTLRELRAEAASHARSARSDPDESGETDASRESEVSDAAQHIVFVLGLDSFNSLPAWHEYEKLFDLCHLLVLNRQGAEPDPKVKELVGWEQRRVNDPEDLFKQPTGRIYFAGDFHENISSTEVRQCLRANENTEAFLDESVRLFIEDCRLYR